MFKGKILSLILLLMPLAAWAYDFEAVMPSGQTLYFSHVAGGVEVVRPYTGGTTAQSWAGYTKPVGALVVPSAVTYGGTVYPVLGVANYAFHSCAGLTSVVLSEGVATVGTGAFYNCSGIALADLPSTLASVGVGAFNGNTSLAALWCRGAVPPVLVGSVFDNVNLAQCELHVPCAAASAYAAVAGWAAFGSVVGEGCMAAVALAVNDPLRGSVTGSGSYAVGSQAVLQATAAPGYRFVCWSDGAEQNPRSLAVQGDTSLAAWFFAVPVDTLWVADTIYYAVIEHDTVYTPVEVHDTVVPTFFPVRIETDNAALGVGVGSALLPAGAEVEVCGLPLQGARFVAWSDGGTDNPRRLTVGGAITLRALFERVGVADVGAGEWTLAASGRRLTVNCAVGERLRLYDMQGRCHLALTAQSAATRVDVPAAGIWLVRVGEGPARRIVIE